MDNMYRDEGKTHWHKAAPNLVGVNGIYQSFSISVMGGLEEPVDISSVEGPVYAQQKDSISMKNLLSKTAISWVFLC